jgi:hypothetical protein
MFTNDGMVEAIVHADKAGTDCPLGARFQMIARNDHYHRKASLYMMSIRG